MVYVYAILDGRPARLPALRGRRLHLVGRDGLYAVVAERRTPPAATPRALRAHDRVVRALEGGRIGVAPARFGTVVPDEETLDRLVRRRAATLRRLLRRLRGCRQMSLRVFGSGAVARAAGTVRRDRARGGAGSPGAGTRYLEARIAERAARRAALDEARRPLAAIASGERLEIFDSGPLWGTVHHLVARSRLRAYLARAAGLGDSGRGPRVRVSGPAPCYAFAGDVRL